MFRYLISVSLIVLGILPCYGADTIETWDKGAADFEVYLGADALGAAVENQEINSVAVLGWGVAERFSAYMATGFTADSYLNNAEPELSLGFFGTPLESEHVDLDLGLNMSVGGPGFSEATANPFFELNLDRQKEMDTWGAYLRGGAEIHGTPPSGDSVERVIDLNITCGTYYCLHAGHQILLEYDFSFMEKTDPGQGSFENGALALGYNVLLNESLELITEARLNIPRDDEKITSGFFAGLIATLGP